jgi:hypothetical protein
VCDDLELIQPSSKYLSAKARRESSKARQYRKASKTKTKVKGIEENYEVKR